MKNAFLIGALAVSVAACSNNEAGRSLDSGSFGNATMNNTLVHNGERVVTIELNTRFAKEVPPKVNFAFNSAVLDEDARAILDRQADWILQFPEVRFRVYGHTDAVGDAGYNKRLGLRRAQAVVAYLGSKGIERSRLEALASFGEEQPLIVTQGRERANRRTVTEVSGFVEAWASKMDGKYADVIYREYVASATSAQSIQSQGSDGFSVN